MLKEEVLAAFEKDKGEVISGIELAEGMGVTRAAIWKAINSLREEGYDIEAIKKKGYRLNVNSDILSTIKIKEHLRSEHYDLRVFKSVDSTNKVARLLSIEEDREWLVVASEMQTLGKGRENTIFLSPEGKGVYMSIYLIPRVHMDGREELMEMIGEAVRYAIRKCTGIQVEIQAPSDIVYEGKKVGGILTEAQVELETGLIESIVVGVGIHIYDDTATGENRISLSEIRGRYCNRSEIIAEVLNALDKGYKGWKCNR